MMSLKLSLLLICSIGVSIDQTQARPKRFVPTNVGQDVGTLAGYGSEERRDETISTRRKRSAEDDPFYQMMKHIVEEELKGKDRYFVDLMDKNDEVMSEKDMMATIDTSDRMTIVDTKDVRGVMDGVADAEMEGMDGGTMVKKIDDVAIMMKGIDPVAMMPKEMDVKPVTDGPLPKKDCNKEPVEEERPVIMFDSGNHGPGHDHPDHDHGPGMDGMDGMDKKMFDVGMHTPMTGGRPYDGPMHGHGTDGNELPMFTPYEDDVHPMDDSMYGFDDDVRPMDDGGFMMGGHEEFPDYDDEYDEDDV